VSVLIVSDDDEDSNGDGGGNGHMLLLLLLLLLLRGVVGTCLFLEKLGMGDKEESRRVRMSRRNRNVAAASPYFIHVRVQSAGRFQLEPRKDYIIIIIFSSLSSLDKYPSARAHLADMCDTHTCAMFTQHPYNA
jgi:hypothetical protein